ncbi:MAG: hypothetical protein ACR2J4_06025, partial [Deinococcus sp.]
STLTLLTSSALAATGVEGKLLYSLDLQAGQLSHLSITLRNSGAAEETVLLGLEDLQVTPLNPRYFPSGTLERSNAAWIKLPASAYTVPGNSSRTVDLTFNVPANAQPGSYWSALIVQPQAGPVAQGPNVMVNTRYAVQLVTNLAGGAPEVRFDKPKLGRENGEVRLALDVLNDGVSATVPAYAVQVYNAGGEVVAQATLTRKRLYPGGGAHLDFKLGQLPGGRYVFLVTANDGVNAAAGARYTVNLKD